MCCDDCLSVQFAPAITGVKFNGNAVGIITAENHTCVKAGRMSIDSIANASSLSAAPALANTMVTIPQARAQIIHLACDGLDGRVNLIPGEMFNEEFHTNPTYESCTRANTGTNNCAAQKANRSQQRLARQGPG